MRCVWGKKRQKKSVQWFYMIDPLAEKYYSISPYAYVANNPLKFTDPTGMALTNYVNEQGELLYKTDDGLVDVIIVRDADIPKLEAKLNETNQNGTIDDPEVNKAEMHILGTKIFDLKQQLLTGDGSSAVDIGLKAGYSSGYEKGNKATRESRVFFLMAWMSPEQGQVYGGFRTGRETGANDAAQGKIHKLNPFSSLKNNPPLIRLK